ncbi:DNA cytosine methyltransferase [Rhizobium sp. 1399]|uniref:DNA cytosine methyltransferase n=1 Tax=Rhizobium sp. 1399 TaxID=2817758 RepID=UPI00285E895F|nr:DNA cytosine methyltransferase [Rhizobium sp. 1399]MDR6663998.1 DNA (cytosine-5)-methyltransferase 1 [Rhizobium sp. 1399]
MRFVVMKFIELFAGAGGLGRGLEAAGMQHGLSFELNEQAADVLVRSGKLVRQTDLNDIAATAFTIAGRPDLVCGGPPCQDFSKAGSREERERARLTPIYAMTIAVLRPQWFILENVDRAPFSKAYHQARAIWKRSGYGLTEVLVDCSHYGVPQRRMRFFTIGRLGERDGFLESAIVDAATPKPMTVRQILNPRQFPEDRALLDTGYYWARPWMGKSGEVGGRGVRSIEEPCPTIIRTTHEPPGPAYVAHPDDAIPANEAHILTLSQIARIQGFPSGFDFRRKQFRYDKDGWSERSVTQMIANAVPSPTAEIIGRCIMEREYNDDGKSIPALRKGFEDFLRKPNLSIGRNGLLPAAISNTCSRVRRARRILKGRTYESEAEELYALDNSFEFAEKNPDRLEVKTRSDLRSALKLYREFEDALPAGKFAQIARREELRLRFWPSLRKTKKPRKKKPNPNAFVVSGPLNLNAAGHVDSYLESPATTAELLQFFDSQDD